MKYGITEMYADNGALSCHTIFDTDSGKHVGFVEDIADLRSQRKDSQRELKATQSDLEQSQERCIAVTGERDEWKANAESDTASMDRANDRLAAMTKERDEVLKERDDFYELFDVDDDHETCRDTTRKALIALGNIQVVEADNQRLTERVGVLEGERDELKAKHAQVHKDLGCELSDPNGTIWQHAARVEADNQRLTERVDELLEQVNTSETINGGLRKDNQRLTERVGVLEGFLLEQRKVFASAHPFFQGTIQEINKALTTPAQPEAAGDAKCRDCRGWYNPCSPDEWPEYCTGDPSTCSDFDPKNPAQPEAAKKGSDG